MLKWVIIVFIAFSLLSVVFIGVNFYFVFRRYETPKYSKYLEYEDVKKDYKRKELTFYSGKNKLQGYLYGEENDKGIVVICHGIFSGARGYLQEACYFADQGYQVFSFDYTGYCNSEGKESVGLRQGVKDLDAALTFVEQDQNFCRGPLYLYGHSWGGYNVTAVLKYGHPISGVVSMSGFDEPEQVIIDWAKKEIGPLALLEYPYVDISQRILFGKEGNASAVQAINGCDTPVLLIHGSEDDVVNYHNVGIMSKRSKITNPNVIYWIRDEEQQNDHTNLYRSKEAISYLEEMNQKYEDLQKKYGKHLDANIEKEFYDSIDKKKSSELDSEFMGRVLSFYESCPKVSR